MQYFVYQYIYQGDVIYIGKTDDIYRRVQEHASGVGLEEKFLPYLPYCDIYYHECGNAVEMDATESLLIHTYKPILNVVDVQDGPVTVHIEMDWTLYRESEHTGDTSLDEARARYQRNIISNETRIVRYLAEVDTIRANVRRLLPFYRWLSDNADALVRDYNGFFCIPEAVIPPTDSVQICDVTVPKWYDVIETRDGVTWVQFSGELLQALFGVMHRSDWAVETASLIGENQCQSILKQVANLRRRNAELESKKDALKGKSQSVSILRGNESGDAQ